jgi:hypothetical protein
MNSVRTQKKLFLKKEVVWKDPPRVQEYTRRNACFVKRLNTRREPIPERMTRAQELRAYITLREAGIRKGDSRIISMTSKDIIAAEAHYHRTC